MKHPDETDAAHFWMLKKAQELREAGYTVEQATQQAVSLWEKSLLRMQAVNKWQKHLLTRGKPTLHVPLFEAARMKAKR